MTVAELGTLRTPAVDLAMTRTNPRHLGGEAAGTAGRGGAVTNAFTDAMLGALDQVSAAQQASSSMTQRAITDPDSVDVHDITIAQAEASLALNITRNVLNRVVQGWKDIINTR